MAIDRKKLHDNLIEELKKKGLYNDRIKIIIDAGPLPEIEDDHLLDNYDKEMGKEVEDEEPDKYQKYLDMRDNVGNDEG